MGPPKMAPPKVPKVEAPKVESGLGVAQIVITAATPMVEEPEPFPPSESEADGEEGKEEVDEDDSSLSEQTAVCVRAEAVPPASSSTASEGESGPPSAPQSPPAAAPPSPPAALRAGRASIPDELEPAQLARLTDLKESNA